MRTRFLSLVILLTAITFGCKPPMASQQAWSTAKSGLGIQDLVTGKGPSPRLGQVCVVEAMGWIEEGGTKGRLFMDTRKRGFPDSFPLGVGRVIKGWEEGLSTMTKGGKRLLRVPADLGYNRRELGDIPEGAVLLFELELVDIK